MYCKYVKNGVGQDSLDEKKSHELRTVWQFYKNGFKGVITYL